MKKVLYFSLFVISIGCQKGGSESIPEKPEAAELSLPANNAICETGTSISPTQSEVVFRWLKSSNTANYDLSIRNLTTGTLKSITAIGETTTTVVLEKGHPYSWTVFSKNTTGDSAQSITWNFYLAGAGVSNYVPFPATLVTPVLKAVIDRNSNGSVDFSWVGKDLNTNDKLTYTLFVDNVDGKQSPKSELTGLTTETASVVLEGNTEYFWRVKTSDGTSSSFSPIFTFTTK